MLVLSYLNCHKLGTVNLILVKLKGNIVTTKRVTMPAFQTSNCEEALMKVTGHCKDVHALVESPPKCQNIFVPGNTTEIEPGVIEHGFGSWN